MMASKKGTIPTFTSDQDERQFWAKHSVEEFADQLEELDVKIQPAPGNKKAGRDAGAPRGL